MDAVKCLILILSFVVCLTSCEPEPKPEAQADPHVVSVVKKATSYFPNMYSSAGLGIYNNPHILAAYIANNHAILSRTNYGFPWNNLPYYYNRPSPYMMYPPNHFYNGLPMDRLLGYSIPPGAAAGEWVFTDPPIDSIPPIGALPPDPYFLHSVDPLAYSAIELRNQALLQSLLSTGLPYPFLPKDVMTKLYHPHESSIKDESSNNLSHTHTDTYKSSKNHNNRYDDDKSVSYDPYKPFDRTSYLSAALHKSHLLGKAKDAEIKKDDK